MSQMASNTAQIKSYNTGIVKNALKALPNGTKTTIARITGLSVTTCNTILNELASTGEIIETSSEYSGIGSVGRPAKAYRFNESFSHIVCINIGFENMKKILTYGVVDLFGNILVMESIVKESISYNEIEKLVLKLIQQHENIKAVGIGIPGVVNRKNMIDFCDIEELTNCPLAEKLSDKFGIDVVVENDMNLIAYGFYHEGEYTEVTSIAVISFFKDNYPGSGIIVDGQIIRGNSNFAGEVSYLPFGYTRDELRKQLSTKEGNVKIVGNTIASIAAIINPETIILTGASLDESMIEEIYLLCSETIPEKHIPKICFYENVDEYYLKGLSSLTLEQSNDLFRKI